MKDGIKFLFVLLVLALGAYLIVYNQNFVAYSKSHVNSNLNSAFNNTTLSNSSSVLKFYNRTRKMNESTFINWIKYNSSSGINNILNGSTQNVTAKASYLWNRINTLKNVTNFNLNNSSKIYNVIYAAFQNITNSSKK